MFCIFGAGWCDADDDIKNQQVNYNQFTALNEFYTERVLNTFVKSESTASNNQSINVSAVGSVLLKDIDMNQYAEATTQTSVDINNMVNDETNIDQMIDLLAKVSSDINEKTEGIFVSGKGIDNTQVQNTKREIKNQFKNLVKQENFVDCISTVINNQTVKITSESNVVINGFKMDQTAKSVSKCIVNSVANIFKKIDLKQSVSDEVVVESTIESEVNSGLQSLFSGISKIQYIIIAIVFAVPAILILIFLMVRKRKGKSKLTKEKNLDLAVLEAYKNTETK